MNAKLKIFLREAQTRRLWTVNGDWTFDPKDTVHFESIETAGEEAIRYHDHDIEVVLRYEEPPVELALNPVYCIKRRLKPEVV